MQTASPVDSTAADGGEHERRVEPRRELGVERVHDFLGELPCARKALERAVAAAPARVLRKLVASLPMSPGHAAAVEVFAPDPTRRGKSFGPTQRSEPVLFVPKPVSPRECLPTGRFAPSSVTNCPRARNNGAEKAPSSLWKSASSRVGSGVPVGSAEVADEYANHHRGHRREQHPGGEVVPSPETASFPTNVPELACKPSRGGAGEPGTSQKARLRPGRSYLAASHP